MAYNAGASSGNLVFIQSQTASGAAAIDFTTGIGSTYNDYQLVIDGVSCSADGQDLTLLVSTDGGSTYKTTNYSCGGVFFNSGGTNASTPSTTYFQLTFNTQISTLAYGNFRLYSLFNGEQPNITGQSSYTLVNAYIGLCVAGFTTDTVVNALRVVFTSGTITGTVKLYGIVN